MVRSVQASRETDGARIFSTARTATAGRFATNLSASWAPTGSVLHSQIVRQWSDDVIYFAHTQPPTESEAAELAARGIRVVAGEVASLVIEDDRLTGVELDNGDVVHRSAVFVRPIMGPRPDHPRH